MSKLLVTLFAGLIATSVFAADAAKPADAAAPAAASNLGLNSVRVIFPEVPAAISKSGAMAAASAAAGA